jgi:DNA-binding transcriptional regulator YdaS (Cro superfamily)
MSNKVKKWNFLKQELSQEDFDQAKKTSIKILRDLILIAGSQARFARLIGIVPSIVTRWLQEGISRRGAILVSQSLEFKGLVAATKLRADLYDLKIYNRILKSRSYKQSRKKQLEFEDSREFLAKSPLPGLLRLLNLDDK